MIKYPDILVVDDEESIRELAAEIFSKRGWNVEVAENAEKGAELIAKKNFDVIISDIMMPGISGLKFLKYVKEVSPSTAVIMITGYPSIDIAVDAVKNGAFDFIVKPFTIDKLELTVKKAVIMSSQAQRDEDAARRKVTTEGAEEISSVHTIDEALEKARDKKEVFRRICELAHTIVDGDKAFVMLYDREQDELLIKTAINYDRAPTGMIISALKEPFKSVIENKCYSYSLVHDRELAPLFDKDYITGELLVVVPVIIKGEAAVLIGITLRGEGAREFTMKDISLLTNLSSKAALKLENISLTENILANIFTTIDSLIKALDARDTYTKDHSQRVTTYAMSIAKAYGCSDSLLESISFAGPLHDIGKIGIRDEILLKKGPFTEEERKIMNTHVLRGCEILKPLNLMESERAVVLYHHERWDGNGYPEGLREDEIPLIARIFSVADTFDAMTTTRPYRKALSFEMAYNEILRCRGTQFDPEVVEAFMDSEIVAMFKKLSKENIV